MGDQNPWNQQNSAVDAFLNNHNAFRKFKKTLVRRNFQISRKKSVLF